MSDKHLIWNGEVVPLTEEQMHASPEIKALLDRINEAPKNEKTNVLYVVDVDPIEKVITFGPVE